MSDKQQNSGQSSPAVSALRKQAEEQARTMVPISLPAQAPEDIQRMFHELRVHQIELEMQNEELRTAQAQIEAKQARHFDIYDEVPVGYCTLSEQGVIQEANLTAATLLGTTRSELVTQPLSRFIFNEDQDIYYLHRKQLFETGTLQKCDLRVIKPEGGYIWAHLKGTVDQTEDGALLGRVVLSDITERKRAEEVLAQSIEERSILLDTIQTQIWYLIDDHTYGAVNKAHADFNGVKIEDMAFKNMYDIFPKDIVEVCRHDNVEVFTTGKPVRTEEWVPHVSGERRLISILKSPKLRTDGTVEYVVCSAEDITERKRVEETLQEREQYQRALLDNAPFAVWLKDTESRFLAVNQGFVQLQGGCNADELIGKNDFDIWPAELAEGYRADDQTVLASGKKKNVEGEIVDADGTRKWFETYMTPIFDAAGSVVGTVGFACDITARKEADAKLQAFNRDFEAFLDQTTDFVYFKDLDSRIRFCSQTLADITGHRNWRDMVGKHDREIFPPDTAKIYEDEEAPVFSEGKPLLGKVNPYFDEQGETGYVQTNKWPLFDADGKLVGIFGISRDITERKRAEEALQESEERFKALHNASFGGIAIHDQGVILECNQGLTEISGFGYDELIGMDGLLLIAEQSRDAVIHNIRSGYEKPYEAFGLRKNGEEYPLLLEARNIPYKGKMVRVVEFRDITERKREEALLVERERLEFVIDGSSLGTWAWNIQTNETIVNEEWAAMLGYTLEELTPTSVETWIALLHPEDLKKAESLLALCLTGEKRDYTCELRMKHKEGHWVWVLDRGRIMTWDDTGKPLSMFGTHDDITDRKHHEQQLAAALSEKEVLLREVHHRVKNNLAAIISLMEMQRRTFEDPNGQIVLTELSNRIRSMSLIHEKLYRADSLATIDFQDYTQTLISHLRTTFGSPDITYRVDAHGITIPLDLASPCGLIVNELITNSLKYAFSEGKPRPGNTDCQILVRLHRDKDIYTLTVADNGIGWPAEFDWTETRTLGLTLVCMLGQHQLGGHFVVDQENGTSITLTFTDRNKDVPVHG